MASYTGQAVTNKVPAFGVPGTISIGGTAKDWDITQITVTPGSDKVEHRDNRGKILSRFHFNNSEAGRNMSSVISVTAIPRGTTEALAYAAGALVPNGTKFTYALEAVTNLGVPTAVGDWECTGFTVTGTNTDFISVTLTGDLNVSTS